MKFHKLKFAKYNFKHRITNINISNNLRPKRNRKNFTSKTIGLDRLSDFLGVFLLDCYAKNKGGQNININNNLRLKRNRKNFTSKTIGLDRLSDFLEVFLLDCYAINKAGTASSEHT